MIEQLGTAGVGLGAVGIQWGRRPVVPPPCRLTRRDLRLLGFLHDFGYATTRILAALFWGRMGTATHERLKLLHDAGMVGKLRPRVGRDDGSHEWIYRLTALGWRTILDAGMAADGEDYAPAELTSIAYVEHDVQVAGLVTALAGRAARATGREGALIDAAPFRMLGPRSGTVDPRREARADAASTAADLGERFVYSEASVPGVLRPDATLVGVTGGGERTAVMLEYDRTRRASKQLTRLRRYDHFLTAGWRESRYAALDVEPALFVVCSDERQLPTFVRAADHELTAWIGRPQFGRSNGEHIGREQVGFTTRERLLAGDGRLLQVPFLPPPIRRGRSTGDVEAMPRQTSLSLDTLFVAA
ncbi:MAG: replication-relaxation family protein [Conexibacter sp.]